MRGWVRGDVVQEEVRRTPSRPRLDYGDGLAWVCRAGVVRLGRATRLNSRPRAICASSGATHPPLFTCKRRSQRAPKSKTAPAPPLNPSLPARRRRTWLGAERRRRPHAQPAAALALEQRVHHEAELALARHLRQQRRDDLVRRYEVERLAAQQRVTG